MGQKGTTGYNIQQHRRGREYVKDLGVVEYFI